MAAERFNVNQALTDKFIGSLEKGIIPWEKPFKCSGGIPHQNLASGHVYSGINVLLTTLTAMEKGYALPYWLTFKQAIEVAVAGAKAEGRTITEKTSGKRTFYSEVVDGKEVPFRGGVRKGEKSTMITYWNRIKVKDANSPGGEKVIPLLKYFNVFNVAQCDGCDHKIPAKIEESTREFTPIESAEMIWENWQDKPTVNHGGDRACYSPQLDFIAMPNPENFVDSEKYYGTLFHEGVHATGHKSRLNRDTLTKSANFGDETYSKEELVAEIGAAFLCAEAGIIGKTYDNSEAYIRGWIRSLNNDPKMIVSAAGKAQKASDYILGIEREKEADN